MKIIKNKIIRIRNSLISFFSPFIQKYPAGHYYSPIPSKKDIKLFEIPFQKEVPGINLNEEQQIDLLKKISAFCKNIPFGREKDKVFRYYYDNGFFPGGDAIVLFGLLLFFKPRRIIEVGSGFSSALMLDVNEYFLDNEAELTFIEPFPQRLFSLLRNDDNEKVTILEEQVQKVDLNIFDKLSSNDLLFIDSSHVSKYKSDVNHIFFNILPRLKSGVIVHFHDIGLHFEYPTIWLKKGIAWNEAYLLRAFLQYNSDYEILFYNALMKNFHQELLKLFLPLRLTMPGSSIYLRRK